MNMLRHAALTALPLALALLLAPLDATHAASAAARVIYAIGEVSAKDPGGTTRAIKKGDTIAPGDTVLTGRGRTQLRATDGTFLALKPNTEYSFADYDFEPAGGGSGNAFYSLLKGGVRMVTGALARKNASRWRLRTSVATLGIRGSELDATLVDNPDGTQTLNANVYSGEWYAIDPVTGAIQDLTQGSWVCNSPCRPLEGPGDPAQDLDAQQPINLPYEGGEDPGSTDQGEGPIPAGPAPDGTHISVSFPFIEDNPSFPIGPAKFLNSLADGEVTDGMQQRATFGTLEDFHWFTGFPCEGCQFRRNGAAEIVDPAPDGSTFNSTYQAEWGRITEGWTITDGFGQIESPTGHFTYVATLAETPDNEIPTSGTMVYDRDVGGTLAALTAGSNTHTEVADVRTFVRMEVDYGNGGSIEDMRIEVAPAGPAHMDNPSPGTFPSGSYFVLQSNQPAGVQVTNGFLSFNSMMSTIVVPAGSAPDIAAGNTGMCAGGCTFFGTAVFGPAGRAADGNAAKAVTGSFQGNTSQFSYPPFSVNGAFIVED